MFILPYFVLFFYFLLDFALFSVSFGLICPNLSVFLRVTPVLRLISVVPARFSLISGPFPLKLYEISLDFSSFCLVLTVFGLVWPVYYSFFV